MSEANKQDSKDFGSRHCSVAYWDEVFGCISGVMDKEPAVHFMDGHQMSGPEGWKAALFRVRSELALLASKSPTNLMVCKQLPWTCGECGTDSVRSLRLADNGDLVAMCDKCGTEWV